MSVTAWNLYWKLVSQPENCTENECHSLKFVLKINVTVWIALWLFYELCVIVRLCHHSISMYGKKISHLTFSIKTFISLRTAGELGTEKIPLCKSPPMAQQPLVGQGLLTVEASLPHSVGLLWTSDQPVAQTSTWQNTTLTTDRHPCSRRDSNPQSHQSSGRRPTP